MVTPPLSTQRFKLPLTGVLLQCLDEEQQEVPGAFASGFIRRESGVLWLYTCWHVVTGFDPNDVQVGLSLPNRRYLRIALQAAEARQPGIEAIGGLQSVDLPLYEDPQQLRRPRWLQDNMHVPHPDLNAVGLFVPFWHDVVKLKLPSNVRVSDLQVIDENLLLQANTLVSLGEKCIIIGYPFGFSALGPAQPTPVGLTRFVAGGKIVGRRRQLLLESIGAPGMSGGPVFVERGNDLLLFGIYTGLIYPDYIRGASDNVTALGTITDLSLILGGYLPLVESPSESASES